jgi:hypothetical protein
MLHLHAHDARVDLELLDDVRLARHDDPLQRQQPHRRQHHLAELELALRHLRAEPT